MSQQWKEYIMLSILKRVIKLTVVTVEEYHCYQLHTKFYLIVLSQG